MLMINLKAFMRGKEGRKVGKEEMKKMKNSPQISRGNEGKTESEKRKECEGSEVPA